MLWSAKLLPVPPLGSKVDWERIEHLCPRSRQNAGLCFFKNYKLAPFHHSLSYFLHLVTLCQLIHLLAKFKSGYFADKNTNASIHYLMTMFNKYQHYLDSSAKYFYAQSPLSRTLAPHHGRGERSEGDTKNISGTSIAFVHSKVPLPATIAVNILMTIWLCKTSSIPAWTANILCACLVAHDCMQKCQQLQQQALFEYFPRF